MLDPSQLRFDLSKPQCTKKTIWISSVFFYRNVEECSSVFVCKCRGVLLCTVLTQSTTGLASLDCTLVLRSLGLTPQTSPPPLTHTHPKGGGGVGGGVIKFLDNFPVRALQRRYSWSYKRTLKYSSP